MKLRSTVLGKIFIFSRKQISPSKLAVVYTRDAHNRDLCQVVQYCSYMDALVSGMWNSIMSGSKLAHARLGMNSSRLNKYLAC